MIISTLQLFGGAFTSIGPSSLIYSPGMACLSLSRENKLELKALCSRNHSPKSSKVEILTGPAHLRFVIMPPPPVREKRRKKVSVAAVCQKEPLLNGEKVISLIRRKRKRNRKFTLQITNELVKVMIRP